MRSPPTSGVVKFADSFLCRLDEAGPICELEICEQTTGSGEMVRGEVGNSDGEMIRIKVSVDSPSKRRKKMSRDQGDIRRQARVTVERKASGEIRVKGAEETRFKNGSKENTPRVCRIVVTEPGSRLGIEIPKK
jgi:hypothetical protein